MWGAIELIEFHANRRMQKSKLGDDFLPRFRRMRNIQQRRKEVGKIQIQSAQSGNEFLNLVRFGIVQLDTTVDLLSQLAPIHIDKRVRTRNLAHNIVGNSGAFPKLGQVQLSHPAALADTVYQVEGVPFSS